MAEHVVRTLLGRLVLWGVLTLVVLGLWHGSMQLVRFEQREAPVAGEVGLGGTPYYAYEDLREDCWSLASTELGHEFPRISLAGVQLEYDETRKEYRKPGTEWIVSWPPQTEPSPLPFVLIESASE